MKPTHVIIVNKNGILSAMPTMQEFEDIVFITDEKIYGAVECDPENAALIHQERKRIRVLAPNLPDPLPENDWLYIGIVNGQIVQC